MTPLAKLAKFFSRIPRDDGDPDDRARHLRDRRNALRNELDEIAGELDMLSDQQVKAAAEAMIAAAALAEAGGPPYPAATGLAAQMIAAYKKSRGEQ
jgi:hypothetical protein